MRMPGLGNSGDTLHATYGVYHLTRLQADKKKDLADAFGKAQDRLKQRMDAYEAAHVATMRSMAVRDSEDEAFDDAVRAFALAIRAKVGNSTRAPLYTKYFGDGLTAVIGAPLETELQKASVLLAKLGEEEDEDLKAHAGSISSATDALTKAIDAHKSAMDAEAQAWGLLETEKVNWGDAYKRSYRELARLYYKDPKKANAYFKPPTRHRGSKADDATAKAAPAAQAS